MLALILAEHGWWLTAGDKLLWVAAILTALTVIAKVPIITRPIRWVGRRLVSDPLKNSTEKVVGGIVKAETQPANDKLDTLLTDKEKMDQFVDATEKYQDDMRARIGDLHDCMDRRFTETHAYIDKLSAYVAEVFTETIGAKERIRQLYRALDVPVFETDARGFCTYVNPAHLLITGLTIEESLQEGWAEAVHPDDKDRLFVTWRNAVANGIDFTSIFRFQNVRTDKITQVRASARPLLDSVGGVVGWIGTLEHVIDS